MDKRYFNEKTFGQIGRESFFHVSCIMNKTGTEGSDYEN